MLWYFYTILSNTKYHKYSSFLKPIYQPSPSFKIVWSIQIRSYNFDITDNTCLHLITYLFLNLKFCIPWNSKIKCFEKTCFKLVFFFQTCFKTYFQAMMVMKLVIRTAHLLSPSSDLLMLSWIAFICHVNIHFGLSITVK